jgi:hypothetical protein
VRHVIGVGSGKGGVGKSTLSVGLAVALSELGARVGLMDLDMWGPSIPTMMGLKQVKLERQGDKILPPQKYGVKVLSMGFFLGDSQPLIWRGPMVIHAMRQYCNDFMWDVLDYMVCDLPPGTGDTQLSLCQLLHPTGVVMVSTVFPWPDPRHMVINLGLGIQLAPLLLLWGLWNQPDMKRLKIFLGAVFVVMALLTIITKHLVFPGTVNDANVGWWERAYAIVLVGWVGVAAIVMERRLRSHARAAGTEVAA